MLSVGAGCAQPVPADFRMIRMPPIMSVEAEEQAAEQDGSPLAIFAWDAEKYFQYIETLRGGAWRASN